MARDQKDQSLTKRIIAYLYAKADLTDFKKDLVPLVENGGCIDHHLFGEIDPDGVVRKACAAWKAMSDDERDYVRNKRNEQILEAHVPASVLARVRRRAVYRRGWWVDPLIDLLIRARERSSAAAG